MECGGVHGDLKTDSQICERWGTRTRRKEMGSNGLELYWRKLLRMKDEDEQKYGNR